MSMTPITPGHTNPDPTEPDLGDLDAAFSRVFNTPPDDAPTVDLAAGESIVDSSTREEGGGEGGVSPAATPPATSDAPTDDQGGATDLTPPDPGLELPDPADGVVIVDDSATPPVDAPADPPPAPAAPTLADELDAGLLMERYLGRKMTVAEGRELLALIDDLSSGRATITPAGQVTQTAPPPQGIQQQPQAHPTYPTTPAAQPQLDEWGMPIDPPAAPSLPPEVAAELEEMRQWRQQQEAAQQQQWQQWVSQEQAAGAQEFASSAPVPLAPEDLIALEIAASRSGIFALEYQRTQNPRAAWKSALEQTLYADPAFRERVIEAHVQSRAVDESTVENRTRLAASVSAGGGSAPGAIPSPVPSGPLDMGTAKQNAARDLQQLWDQQ